MPESVGAHSSGNCPGITPGSLLSFSENQIFWTERAPSVCNFKRKKITKQKKEISKE
jgi:hypothetical protein